MEPTEAAVPPFKLPATRAGGRSAQAGKVGWLLLWLVGIPVPVLLVLFLLRGCT